MAPRTNIKRKKSDVQEVVVKKAPSITSNVTITTVASTSTSRRASQPLAPSTSQNSVVKTTTTKHKPRKPSQPKIVESAITVKQTHSRQPASSSITSATISSGTPKLNVYVFGSGSMGELGLGPQSNQRNVKRPRLNTNLLPQDVGIVDIAVGGMHCAAIDEKGRVWTWGVNDQGVLGRDTTWSPDNEDTAMESDDEEDDEQLNPRESTPGLVEGFPEGTVITKIACGDSITVAVTNEGKVYAWGTFRVNPYSR
jgi:regulator of chromosome condensation